MEICVAGLGIIGGSMCMALKRAGYRVSGWNRSKDAVEYAVKKGIIDSATESFDKFDVVFVALPPEATVDFIETHSFKDGAVVSDICGVKEWMEKRILSKVLNFNYIGCHPMAGKEVSGIYNASETLFDGASMIITRYEGQSEAAHSTIERLTKDMGFGRIVECSAAIHDKKIAYTSQLAHVLSNAYVKDDEIDACIGFTGGSFQDMTRIAGVDERVWSSLYLLNAENLSEKISSLISSLEQIKDALEGGDKAELEDVLRCGRERFEARRESAAVKSGITVKYLK